MRIQSSAQVSPHDDARQMMHERMHALTKPDAHRSSLSPKTRQTLSKLMLPATAAAFGLALLPKAKAQVMEDDALGPIDANWQQLYADHKATETQHIAELLIVHGKDLDGVCPNKCYRSKTMDRIWIGLAASTAIFFAPPANTVVGIGAGAAMAAHLEEIKNQCAILGCGPWVVN